MQQLSHKLAGAGGALEDPRMNDVVSKVYALQEEHNSVISQLNNIKRENAVVWTKYNELSTRFNKQQSVINKVTFYLSCL